MKENFTQKLDSDIIRQGLLSIRNSQIQLLNQLKTETQQLKKTPIRFGSSTQDSRSEQRAKMDDIFSHPPQNVNSQVRYNPPPSPISIQKPFSFGFSAERQVQSQITYLKDQNKMLNQTIQKLLYSRSGDKQRIRQLESYLYFSQKMNIQLISQLVSGTPIVQTKKWLQNDLQLNKDVYSKYQQRNHPLIVQLLQDREIDFHPVRSTSQSQNLRQRQMSFQLGQLKDQLAMLVQSNHQKNTNKPNSQAQIDRLREQEEILKKKCEDLQKRINKLESDNKELALCWQREINERKTVISQLEKIRRESGSSVQKQNKVSGFQQALQNRLSVAQKLLQEKQAHQSINHENARRLSDTITLLKQENERMKRQIKSIDQIRTVLQKEDNQILKQVENEMKAKLLQQGAMLRNYEQEIFDLRNHLAEVKRNQEIMFHAQAKQKQTELANQEIYWRKVHTIKTNSTVQHLWQVKKVEYDNINELLLELRQKNIKI